MHDFLFNTINSILLLPIFSQLEKWLGVKRFSRKMLPKLIWYFDTTNYIWADKFSFSGAPKKIGNLGKKIAEFYDMIQIVGETWLYAWLFIQQNKKTSIINTKIKSKSILRQKNRLNINAIANPETQLYSSTSPELKNPINRSISSISRTKLKRTKR